MYFSLTLFLSSRPTTSMHLCSLKDAVIVSTARTAVGKFNGPMSALSGPQLGAIAIREAVARVPGTARSSFVDMYSYINTTCFDALELRSAEVSTVVPTGLMGHV